MMGTVLQKIYIYIIFYYIVYCTYTIIHIYIIYIYTYQNVKSAMPSPGQGLNGHIPKVKSAAGIAPML